MTPAAVAALKAMRRHLEVVRASGEEMGPCYFAAREVIAGMPEGEARAELEERLAKLRFTPRWTEEHIEALARAVERAVNP